MADLELDSLAIVELTMALQDDWGIDLEDIDTPPELTLAQLLTLADNAPTLGT
ncbi:hypothetical protein [Streptomyces sp. NBC_00690]|uniref:hypothetical protein n=1 Tax=Streptomyces sp. NBC_00690 TaxID=2975808 RepID=UPI002E2C8523|nr:hypothetical protein [Streptomyces sp. NBC_00690]